MDEEEDLEVSEKSLPPLPTFASLVGCDPFFAVWLLEQAWARRDALDTNGGPAPSRIRLRAHPALGLPYRELEAVTHLPEKNDAPARSEVSISGFGLYGTGSPLPLWYSAAVLRDAVRNQHFEDGSGERPPTSVATLFLDLFNHRLLLQRYKIWLRSRPFLPSPGSGEGHPLTSALSHAMGLEDDSRDYQLPAAELLRFASLYLLRNRPAAGLQSLLNVLVQKWLPEERRLRLSVEPLCTARKILIPPEQRPRMASQKQPAGGRVRATMTMGRDALVGGAQYVRQNQLGIRIGPVGYETMRKLMPGGALHAPLLRWISSYARPLFEISLSVSVPRHLLPPARFSRDAETAPRIGGTMPLVMRRGVQTTLLAIGLAPPPSLAARYNLIQVDDVEVGAAVALVAQKKPDLVLLSLRHLALCASIRQHPDLAAIPQVVLKSDADEGDIVEQAESALWSNCTRFSVSQPLAPSVSAT